MKHKSLKKRLMYAMIGIAIIPIIALSSFTASYLSRILEREIMTTNETKMAWVSQYAQTVIDQVNDSFYSLRLDQTLLSSMQYQNDDELMKKKYIIETLTKTLYQNANIINEIILYDHQTGHLSTLNYRLGGTFQTQPIANTPFETLLNRPDALYFMTYQNMPYVVHSINKFEDQSFLGGIAFRLNDQVIGQLDHILSTMGGSFYVLNKNHMYLGGTHETLDTTLKTYVDSTVLEPKIIYDTQDNETLIWSVTSSNYEITILKTLPVKTIRQVTLPIQLITLMIAAIALGVSIFMAFMISNRITHPILRLVKRMQQTPLDLISLNQDDYDEISHLEKNYNEMIETIKTLIVEKYQRNLELKTAQLKTLQSQMNPHFLNNTFQLIGGMALTQKAHSIYDITSSMGEMMKYALNKDEETLPLKDEIKHLNHFLDIQKQRFINRVKTEISYDSNHGHYAIPKFTLQPLVENSFKHGFKQKDGKWVIKVNIEVSEDIIITITDNGIGMTKEKADSINAYLNKDEALFMPNSLSDSTGIGLHNIYKRIRLLYDEPYGLYIYALEDGGTKVVVTIPKQERNSKNHV